MPDTPHYPEHRRPSVGFPIGRKLRSLLRLPAIAARRIREQAQREEFARLDARLARLEPARPHSSHELTSRQPQHHPPRTHPDDPLELLWKLAARQP